MYYTRILPKLIVGSQPQNVDDVSRLHHEEGVDVILNLQQDHDMAYWGIDLHPIKERCDHHGVRHYRRPVCGFSCSHVVKDWPIPSRSFCSAVKWHLGRDLGFQAALSSHRVAAQQPVVCVKA